MYCVIGEEMFNKDTHILVVDDSVNIRRVIVDGLASLGFRKIVAASDVKEGLGRLNFFVNSPTPIQLVISDLNMPGPSGLDFLRTVRSDERFKTLPFLLVTTESEKGSVISAAIAGVSGYVIKPFNLETLASRLKDAWKKHVQE